MLPTLSEDNVRSIFQFCDVRTVLAVGRTNKSLHRLTRDKLVWIYLVDNLRRKGFVDLRLSEIQSLSSEALVDLVKRMVVGPASWTPPKRLPFLSRLLWGSPGVPPPPPAQICRQFVVHAPGITPSRTKLLPGGEYVLLTTYHTLECWSVREDRLIWAHQKVDPDSVIIDFAADMQGGNAVNLILYERPGAITDGRRDRIIQVLHLDLQTGISASRLRNTYRDPLSHSRFKVYICGDLACVWTESFDSRFTPWFYSCILLHWPTNAQITLTANESNSRFLVTLLPEHIVFVEPHADRKTFLGLIPNSVLAPHWKPCTPHLSTNWQDAVCSIQELPCIRVLIKVGLLHSRQSSELASSTLYAHESPLEDGMYRIWICTWGFTAIHGQRLLRSSIYRYNLLIPAGDISPEIRRGPSRTWGFNVNGAGTGYGSFSEHFVIQQTVTRCKVFCAQEESQGVEFYFDGIDPYTSTYSGAITYTSDDSVVVAYFS